MTTIMFELHIWVSDRKDTEMRAALNAGWRRSDLVWERLQEKANQDWKARRRTLTVLRFCTAYCLALLSFASADPRRITSLANVAFAARLLGAGRIAEHGYRAVCERWPNAASLDAVEIHPRARSSLFHLQMEARHWDIYRANTRERLRKFRAESEECLHCLLMGEPVPHRLYSRWIGEKPSVFDDTRKILGACLLVASDPPQPARTEVA